MKKLFTVTALTLALISTAHADTGQREICSIISGAAEAVMTVRQAGVPIREVMEIYIEKEAELLESGGSDLWPKLFEALTIDAYRVPLQPTAIHRQIAIKEFESEHYLLCRENFLGD